MKLIKKKTYRQPEYLFLIAEDLHSLFEAYLHRMKIMHHPNYDSWAAFARMEFKSDPEAYFESGSGSALYRIGELHHEFTPLEPEEIYWNHLCTWNERNNI